MRRLKDYKIQDGQLAGREADLTLLSLGAGVQSSALAVMAYSDDWPEIPRPDAIIRAEVHAEMPKTDEFLHDHLYPWLKKKKAEVHVIDAGSLYKLIIEKSTERGYNPLPCWTPTPKGMAPLPHDCCTYTKVTPIIKKTRELLGLQPKEHASGKFIAEMWLGISAEEKQRARAGWEDWLRYTYPLIENDLTRADCKKVFKTANLPIPPRSSCWFCPLQSPERWKKIKKKYPKHWKAAIKLDETIRDNTGDQPAYLHPDGIPLEKICQT